MVNHIRTTLLNVVPAQAPDDIYIDPKFRTVDVPDYLSHIYDVVLSPKASDVVRADRVNTLMRLLHAGDYEQYVYLPDTRITYDPHDQDKFFDSTTDTSASIDFEQLLNRMRAAVDGLDARNKSLFQAVEAYPVVMSQLKAIWSNDLAGVGRLTAAVLALAYKLDDISNAS